MEVCQPFCGNRVATLASATILVSAPFLRELPGADRAQGFDPAQLGPHVAVVSARPAFQVRASSTLRFDILCRPEDVTAYFNDVLTDASLAGAVVASTNLAPNGLRLQGPSPLDPEG